jgi:hypothetical protein
MTVFARVLDATRLNLAVMRRLEYGERPIIGMLGMETAHGVD